MVVWSLGVSNRARQARCVECPAVGERRVRGRNLEGVARTSPWPVATLALSPGSQSRVNGFGSCLLIACLNAWSGIWPMAS